MKSAVNSEPNRTLKTLLISDNNYNAAWQLLCERYEVTNELIDYHVDALFSLSGIRKDSSDKLRQLIDDFNNHLRSLISLEEPVDRWDTILVQVLIGKLDTRTIEEWKKRVYGLDREKPFPTCKRFLNNSISSHQDQSAESSHLIDI